jgi:uncharacterized membrane protein YqiK
MSPALIIEIVKYTSVALAVIAVIWFCGVRYIPHNRVGIIEKLWSRHGSLTEGKIISLEGEAGYASRLLRGGIHFGFYPWQYRLHRHPLVTVAEGKIGYVYARDGTPLPPTQTLGRCIDCNRFQDARAFIVNGGQRGRQRDILREGVYAINTALFVIITEDGVYAGPVQASEREKFAAWQSELLDCGGFSPVIIGAGSTNATIVTTALQQIAGTPAEAPLMKTDNLGVVSVQDGPTIASGEIIAPEVGNDKVGSGHNYFQDPESFLALGGRRGRQLQVLTDGTFFINRWFATVEIQPKTLIPIGYVGVVVSYYGVIGRDLTGDAFRYGEQVEPGERGVWKRALPPGKYALNPYSLKIELVPTVNFVLRWISGQTEAHRYDAELESIELITADGYEPLLPLSLVLHIDYEKAPSVIQRFGDVKRLISQTLDPILTAYFRDVAQSSSMLDLLTKREDIQARATQELGRRFSAYDINCVAVLIGRPESKLAAGTKDDPIDRLFDQLRLRRLAEEQKATYNKQEEAAVRLKELNQATAAAEKQAQLTQTKIDIEIAGNRGSAQLAEAEQVAKRDIALAEGESRSKELLGIGEAARIASVGAAEASVNRQKVDAYGDPRLYVANLLGDQLSRSHQPLVPERLIVLGGDRDEAGKAQSQGSALLNLVLGLLAGEKAGIGMAAPAAEPKKAAATTATPAPNTKA